MNGIRRLVLTEFGEAIVPSKLFQGRDPEFFGTYLDGGPNRCSDYTLRVHEVCHGFVDIAAVSDTHNALVCRACHLRVYVPKAVESYAQLAEHFAALNPPPTDCHSIRKD